MAKLHRLAATIRRFPILLHLPYRAYRLIQPKYTVGVVGVLFNDAGKILLVEHVFHPKHPWGLPGGWIGKDEIPEKAIAREFHEELQIHIEAERLLLLERTQPNHLDIAFGCTSNETIGELSFELLSYDWFSLDELPAMYGFQRRAIAVAAAAKGVQ